MFARVTARRMHILFHLVNDFLEEKRTFVTLFLLWESGFCVAAGIHMGSRRIVLTLPCNTKYSDPQFTRAACSKGLQAIDVARVGAHHVTRDAGLRGWGRVWEAAFSACCDC